MNRNGLILGIAAVLLGITVLMVMVGIVINPFFLLVALPFGATAYLMWYQASGKLADRIRSNPDAYARDSRGAAGRGPGSFGAGAFTDGRFTREQARRNRQRARQGGRRTRRASQPSGLSRTEASRILGVDSSAQADEIKTAYREKVKTAHPDAPDGDEEAFKSVRRAYETLTD